MAWEKRNGGSGERRQRGERRNRQGGWGTNRLAASRMPEMQRFSAGIGDLKIKATSRRTNLDRNGIRAARPN
jgi:hypothetical protein